MELRKRFGILFQGAALFDSMTICENVGLMLRGAHRLVRRADPRAGLRVPGAWWGWSGTEDKLPSELSGGMKKRAGLARAIVMEPQYILYDEPTTGLDPITGDAINDLILKLQTRAGRDQHRGHPRHAQRLQGRRPHRHAQRRARSSSRAPSTRSGRPTTRWCASSSRAAPRARWASSERWRTATPRPSPIRSGSMQSDAVNEIPGGHDDRGRDRDPDRRPDVLQEHEPDARDR